MTFQRKPNISTSTNTHARQRHELPTMAGDKTVDKPCTDTCTPARPGPGANCIFFTQRPITAAISGL